jgi:hypothetical protein
MMARPRITRFGPLGGITVVICLTQLADSNAVAQSLVDISGGPDETGHRYTWTVRNNNDSPIVFVEFPHYGADLFTVPDGWTEEIVHPATEGPGKEGRCTAAARSAEHAIRTGGSATFSLRLGPYAGTWGVRHGEGDVIIRFADGTQTTARAPAPRMESTFSRYLPLIVVGLVLLVLLVRRSRRLRGRGPSPSGGPEGQSS